MERFAGAWRLPDAYIARIRVRLKEFTVPGAFLAERIQVASQRFSVLLDVARIEFGPLKSEWKTHQINVKSRADF